MTRHHQMDLNSLVLRDLKAMSQLVTEENTKIKSQELNPWGTS